MCSKNPPQHSSCCHKFSDAAVKALKDYVERGGYLFTEDWGLPDVLERAWPRLVKAGTYLPQCEVDVSPARGNSTHPFLRGVFVEQQKIIKEEDAQKLREKEKEKEGSGTTPAPGKEEEQPKKKVEEQLKKAQNKWKVDDESPHIIILDKTNVTVLLVSKDVSDRAQGNGTVAFTFGGPRSSGGGEAGPADVGALPVRGCVLHILSHFGRQQQKVDEFATQNLLLNFLLESHSRRAKK